MRFNDALGGFLYICFFISILGVFAYGLFNLSDKSDEPDYSSHRNSLDGCGSINFRDVNTSFIGEAGGYTQKCAFGVRCYTGCVNSSLEGLCVYESERCWDLNKHSRSISLLASCYETHNDFDYCNCLVNKICERSESG